MKKFILKQLLTVSLITLPAAVFTCTADEHKTHADFVNQLVTHITDFAAFSADWSIDFFDTKNNTSFAEFTQRFTHAKEKFEQLVVNPLKALLARTPRHSSSYRMFSQLEELVSQIYKPAHHVSVILNKNLHNRNATFVGIALLETKKYTSSNTIKDLEKTFDKCIHELRKEYPHVATHACEMRQNIIQSRKFQHDMSMNEQRKALSHRIKC